MSNPNTNGSTTASNEKKPLTGNFQLQTKIRVIIQEVLAATIRKLSHFGQKIQKFEEYFITFRERFETGERERVHMQDEMNKVSEVQTNIRRELNFKDVKYNEDKERAAILYKEGKEEYAELEKSVKSLLRQNQNINAELSKTKSKFLEYSNTITTLKEEVSWKITKYLEQTAESHTQMRVFAEGIKIENFNMNLLINKQKEKYDQIILKWEDEASFKQETKNKLDELAKENAKRIQQNSRLNSKIDDIELSVLSKMKNSDNKFEDKMKELDKNNTKLSSIFKKIDNFNELLEGLKADIEEQSRNTSEAMEQTLKKAAGLVAQEIVKVSKESVKLQKKFQKNILATEQKVDKLEDFLLQKLQFVKMEIQSNLSSKTVKILEQKSRNEQHLNNSSIDEINSKISRLQLETTKNISKTENSLREQIDQVKKQVEKVKEEVEASIQQKVATKAFSIPAPSVVGPSVVGTHISHQNTSNFSGELTLMKEMVRNVRERVEVLQSIKETLQKSGTQLKKGVQDKFVQLDEKLNSKVEKVMFLVTKMRGDSIIRNQFNDREIKELKKNHIEFKERMETTWKLIPGIGECINLIMALIFDAQYQHSKIIQDNLPMLAKDMEKFNTCCEGVIYEYREKKKPGIICYRHSQVKKTDLVRATFNGYIQLWEQIYEVDFKNKQHLLPKSFYKRLVEKLIKQGGRGSIEKELPINNSGQLPLNSMHQMRTSGNIPSEPSETMNSSFHIRKKKTYPLKQRQREDLLEGTNEDLHLVKQ